MRRLLAKRGRWPRASRWTSIWSHASKRRKKLLVADMDSTIINVECLDELADMAGLKPQIAAITERAMRGELEFEAALARARGHAEGPDADRAGTNLCRAGAAQSRRQKRCIATMRAHGAHTMLVSGGFGYFTRRVAEAAGFHAERGNTLLDDGEALTGEVGHAHPGARSQSCRRWRRPWRRLELDFAETLAVGDGANDLAMIRKAGLGVAYHAKPRGRGRGGRRRSTTMTLTALLYLQGYSDA